MNQQGARGGMEYYGVVSGSRRSFICRNYLFLVVFIGVVKTETEEVRGEEVVLGAVIRYIELDVVYQGSRMICQVWRF